MSKLVLVEVEHDWVFELGFHNLESDLPVQKAATIEDVVAIAKKYPERAVVINTLPRECKDPKTNRTIQPPAYFFERALFNAGLNGAVFHVPPVEEPFDPGFVHCVNLL